MEFFPHISYTSILSHFSDFTFTLVLLNAKTIDFFIFSIFASEFIWEIENQKLSIKFSLTLEILYFNFYIRPVEITTNDYITRMKVNDSFLKRLSFHDHAKNKFILRGGLITRQFIYPIRRWSADIDFISLTPVTNLTFVRVNT